MRAHEFMEVHFGETSVFQAFISIIRYPVGISLFLLPWAMKFGGLIGGPLIVTIFIVINAYRSIVLAKVAEELSSLGIPSPAGCSDWWVFESSMGKVQKSTVNWYLVIFSALQWVALLGHASAFLAFAGSSLHQIWPNENCPDLAGDRIYIAVCTAIVVVLHPVTQWIRNRLQEPFVRWRCPTIISAFLFLLIPAFLAVFFGFPVIVTQMMSGKRSASIDVQWDKITLLLAGVSFVIGGTPDDITGAFGNLHTRSIFPYIVLGISGATFLIGLSFAIAVMVGIDGKTCGSVTFNLPLEIGRFDTVRILSSVAAILFVSFRHQIEPRLSNRLSISEISCDIIFKVCFLLVSGSIAVGFPRFAELACIFGSVTSFIFTFIFPFLCDLLLHVTGGRVPDEDSADEGTRLTSEPPRQGQRPASRSVMRIIRDVIFIVLGVAGMIAGLVGTVQHINTVGRKSAACDCPIPPFKPAAP